MPKITNWVKTEVPFGEDNSPVTVVTADGFTRHWEQSQVTVDGHTVKALMYRTESLCVFLHTDVVDFSGDNAVTVWVIDGDWERYIHRNLRLSDGGNAIYTVEEALQKAFTDPYILKWA